ncbi:MAG: pyridoxal-phosphate dependent enzyme [Gammaproteobacteria bacterium]|nr:pyridoxal-phosphate dependent enzyme [Gammaproteobacteria bacterium]
MGNVILKEDRSKLANGVYTASSGNAGIGLAWMAKKLGLVARVYTPESGPQGKLDTMSSLGASVEVLSDNDWWQVIVNSSQPSDKGFYVDAVRSPAALAGNATMGLEILEQLPDVNTIIVPFGGGGVACGIASALQALKPESKMVVAESDTAAPVTAALAAGQPTRVETKPSFISGAGAPVVLEEMWPLVNELVDDTIVVPAAEVAGAIGLLFDKNHVVAEGAGALPLAAALAGNLKGKIVCVVTGGNIDRAVLSKILAGEPV